MQPTDIISVFIAKAKNVNSVTLPMKLRKARRKYYPYYLKEAAEYFEKLLYL
jgi:hypothetical protein